MKLFIKRIGKIALALFLIWFAGLFSLVLLQIYQHRHDGQVIEGAPCSAGVAYKQDGTILQCSKDNVWQVSPNNRKII